MKKLALTAAAAAMAFALPTAANATISVTVTPGQVPYIGPPPTYDFETPGTTPTFSGGAVVGPGTTPGSFAQPFGSTGQYFSVGPSTSEPGVIDLSSFGDIFNISFIWGSVDAYNTLEFLAADGSTVLATFVGNDIFNPANGNQSDPNTNPLVTFNLTGTDVSNFAFLRMNSNGINAFEIDNLAVNGVPEPSTWAMMLLGFGAIGIAMRRRKSAIPQVA